MPVIEISKIITNNRTRKVNTDKVEQLAKSIEQVGMINPIILAGNILVAGAHRLEAHKLLGREVINYETMGNQDDSESMELIEIDENLFRNELSESERAEHFARRVKIIAKRKMPEYIAKLTSVRLNSPCSTLRKKGKSPNESEVNATAMRNAESDAKIEAAKEIGVKVDLVRRSIKNHNDVSLAGLNKEDLRGLNGVQYRRVADIASKQGKEAAEKEMEIHLTNNKRSGSKSCYSHDKKAVLKGRIKILTKALSTTDGLKDEYNYKEIDRTIKAVTALVERLRSNL